jgi:hypothetical protein
MTEGHTKRIIRVTYRLDGKPGSDNFEADTREDAAQQLRDYLGDVAFTISGYAVNCERVDPTTGRRCRQFSQFARCARHRGYQDYAPVFGP